VIIKAQKEKEENLQAEAKEHEKKEK